MKRNRNARVKKLKFALFRLFFDDFLRKRVQFRIFQFQNLTMDLSSMDEKKPKCKIGNNIIWKVTSRKRCRNIVLLRVLKFVPTSGGASLAAIRTITINCDENIKSVDISWKVFSGRLPSPCSLRNSRCSWPMAALSAAKSRLHEFMFNFHDVFKIASNKRVCTWIYKKSKYQWRKEVLKSG